MVCDTGGLREAAQSAAGCLVYSVGSDLRMLGKFVGYCISKETAKAILLGFRVQYR